MRRRGLSQRSQNGKNVRAVCLGAAAWKAWPVIFSPPAGFHGDMNKHIADLVEVAS
jgi:hypothetical protein